MKKLILRGTIAGMITSYMLALAWIKPTLKQLFSFRFYMEFPMKLMFKMMAFIFPAVAYGWGERGVKAMQYVLYEAGRGRGRLMREKLRIDPNDARSLGRVIDYEDGIGGLKGLWTQETKGCATKEEKYCPVARELESCPEVCTCLMIAMEAGTFAGWAPRIIMPKFEKLLSVGDDCCTATLKLKPVEGSAEKDGETSPQATPGAFPPVLKVPGLPVRMAMAMGTGAMKGMLKVMTSGPGEME